MPKINAERLWSSIIDTARVGGTPKGGVRRLTLSDEDRQIRDWFTAECVDLGGTVTVDEIGNMFALFPGENDNLQPIAMGSHLDTQPTGGKFDGILGVLAGLEALRTLRESGKRTHHPLMLVNWTNEEGARFAPAMLGSGVHAGVFTLDYACALKDDDGLAFGDELERIGYRGPASIGSVRFAAMFELHIEQGPILEREEMVIGAVNGVQGIRWFDVKASGAAAHSGSTPMDMRADALLAAAELVRAVQSIGVSEPDAVATVGHVEVLPNSRNVVPGEVNLTVDLRNPDETALDRMDALLRTEVARIAQAGPCTLEISEFWRSPAVLFDDDCLAAVAEGAAQAGHETRRMFSGAGHDSVYAARVAPTAMIFVPCAGGVSHNEAESATPQDCATGAQVLLNAVLSYDRQLAAKA